MKKECETRSWLMFCAAARKAEFIINSHEHLTEESAVKYALEIYPGWEEVTVYAITSPVNFKIGRTIERVS